MKLFKISLIFELFILTTLATSTVAAMNPVGENEYVIEGVTNYDVEEIVDATSSYIDVEDLDLDPQVPVLEYHNIHEIDSRWGRSYDSLYDDLLWLYNNDYRVVTIDEFLNMKFNIDPGMKPVIITFDDASQGQFDVQYGGLGIDPLSGMGVLNEFAQDHPDFGLGVTFFALPWSFGQAEFIDDKLKYIVNTGRDLQGHTYGHETLSDLTGVQIQESLAKSEMYMQEHTDSDIKITAIAYPLGIYPDGDLFEYVKKGEFEGHEYQLDAAFLVGAHPTVMPDHADFDPYRIPRIQAVDEEWERWFNRMPGETDKSDDAEKFKPYVAYGEYALGAEYKTVSDLPDLTFYESIDDEVVEEEGAEGTEEEVAEEVLEEPKYPYQTCKSFEFESMTFGEYFWKRIDVLLSKVQINPIPDTLTYYDDNFYYTITGEEEGSIASMFLPYSRHYRTSKFRAAIVDANPEKDFVEGDEVVIPDIPIILLNMGVNHENQWGVYLTSYYSVSDEGEKIVNEMQQEGGGMIVFDVKEIDGYVYYPSEVELVAETGADAHIQFPSLENFVRFWHEKDVYLAARVVIFKDINLARSRPDLAIQNSAGVPWENREGAVWVDPSNVETQDYILDLVEEIAKTGVDEIQFDYIRFPTLGLVNETRYNFDEENMEKYEVIRNFIARADDRLSPYDTKLSLDVYGVIVWNDGYDSRSTGQRMECLGPFIDVVYPMVYPSHFGPGFAGYASPGDEPYYFVYESLKLFDHYLEGTNTKIRPWLQAFSWRVSNYGQWYIDEQVKAGKDLGIEEYTLWNASNNYFNL